MKILIPIEDMKIVNRVSAVLATNEELNSLEIILLKVIEPAWLDNPPFSAIAGISLLNKQNAQAERETAQLQTVASALKMHLPEVAISMRVIFGARIADAIAEFAEEWNADLILMLTKADQGMDSLFKKSLARQVIDKTDKLVYVIKPPVHDNMPKLRLIPQGSVVS